MYEWGQGLTLTQNVDWGFLLSTTFPEILCSLGPKKETRPSRKACPVSLKESRQANPLQVPQQGPYGEKDPPTGHFYLSLNIFPSESPVREPLPCSLTQSPWAAILRHQSHWSTFHSSMSARVPKKEPFCIHMGKNIRSWSTEPHADGRPTYNGVRPGSPRGWNSIKWTTGCTELMSILQNYWMVPWLSETNTKSDGFLASTEEIYMDVPTQLEINSAPAKPKNNKAPGSDSILAERNWTE
jgi:hypothetical protein